MHQRLLLAACVAGVATLSACATDTSSCADAAAQLTTCSDDQRQAFIAACEEAGGADPAALVSDDATAACKAAPSDGKEDAQTSAETGVCIAAMYSLKWTITALSPTGLPLSDSSKAILRPLYGSLVDQIVISPQAALPPRIVIGGHRLSVKPDAMTFGDHIFLAPEVTEDTKTPNRVLLTTVHELTHVKQAAAAGGFYGFATNYCRDMIASGFDYSNIGMEKAAYAAAGAAQKSLQSCGKVVCN